MPAGSACAEEARRVLRVARIMRVPKEPMHVVEDVCITRVRSAEPRGGSREASDLCTVPETRLSHPREGTVAEGR